MIAIRFVIFLCLRRLDSPIIVYVFIFAILSFSTLFIWHCCDFPHKKTLYKSKQEPTLSRLLMTVLVHIQTPLHA